jgi:anaerobic ribonucleoside-triphosphate reductase activating protein
MCYTGYRLEELREAGQLALLERVDLLIDGPYLAAEHADLLWRGSANQRLIALTPRYRSCLPEAPEDRGVGLEFRLLPGGRLGFSGVPPWPGYREHLLRACRP